jgi:hypothetical protein
LDSLDNPRNRKKDRKKGRTPLRTVMGLMDMGTP